MKIVNREEFLKMPSGTLFRKIDSEYITSDFGIKVCQPKEGAVDFITVDFTITDFKESNKSEDYFNIWDDLHGGGEHEADWDNMSRDGMFDEDQMFLVYSNKEYDELIELLIKYRPPQD